MITTYRAKGKKIGLVMLFNYDLKGNLKAFSIDEGVLDPTQQNWLFDIRHFPSNEDKMKFWASSPDFLNKFDVQIIPADLSFENAWNIYNYKMSKKDAEKAYVKMTTSEKIDFFISLPKYEGFLKKSKTAKAYLATYINGRYFENEYPEVIGKVYNPMLHDLAAKIKEKNETKD